MNKLVSGLLCFVLLIAATSANAVTNLLTNYSQLVKALERGDDVKAIIRLDFCDITDPELQSQLAQNIDAATTRINFTQYLHFKTRINEQLRDIVTTSTEQLIENTPGVFLQMIARLNVLDDNTATLRVNFYNHNLSTGYLVVDFECDISNGKDENGLLLYDSP
ncbi:hypothetical protein [Legionella waltersii]|uniref:DUF3887 domain-containing protein n=1 Tax=Legionella waltersii TaxID=66969 RepID=A0A0W1A024_9GAMM|nr:hypothetical protein [Legionella waltersii]KTD74676.1 hypothetical protein Lwal_2717 [Legionella waltersii]SNV09172.1 Uncharacterised protein [Legionella waltersii]